MSSRLTVLLRDAPRVARHSTANVTGRTSFYASACLSRRSFATHKDPHSNASSLLSQQLEQAATRNRTRSALNSQSDTVGPFVLGIPPSKLQSGPQVKKWSELSASGKVLRTTARTTNFTVILLGAGLSALLAYALSTELFSKNSPTVLYGDACKRIESSEALMRLLPGPLSFQTTPPSPLPPRHRNRHVQSQLAVDSNGTEHLILHFWVSSNPNLGENADSEGGWFNINIDMENLSFDDLSTWTRMKARETADAARKAFAYLTGNPLPPIQPVALSLPQHQIPTVPQNESKAWSFFGLFKSLRGTKGKESKLDNGVITTYDSGEVHADLVKDTNGVFQFRYLIVDLPNSKSWRPKRIFVTKGQGYRESDGMIILSR